MHLLHSLAACIARVTEADVATVLLRCLKVHIDASAVHALGLNGAKLTQHERFSDFIEDINAVPSEYVEFLRLFASVKFMHLNKRNPKDTCIADEVAKYAPEVADKFRAMRFTEVMMREMEPGLFVPRFGMTAGDLRKIQKVYIELVESSDDPPDRRKVFCCFG
jgi:hypothetical protein